MKCLLPVLLAMPLAASAAFSVEERDGLVHLDNGSGIRAVVAPEHGGELSGFSVKINGEWQELIYRALDYSGKPGWRGKAPLLWPATGVSYTEAQGKHHWLLDGTTLPMLFHGFARDQSWRVERTATDDGSASVMLEIAGEGSERPGYPFGFSLQVKYILDSEKLSLSYRVSAAGDNARPMPFSIGNHITFKAPLIPGSKTGSLQFHNDFPLQLLRDGNGAFSGEVRPSTLGGWHAVSELPRRDAVSLGGRSGAAELLLRDPSGLHLRLVHRASSEPSEPAVRFNLWADADAGFFSPEPWLGTQNALNSGTGLILLNPGERWDWQIDIIPFRPDGPFENQKEETP